MIHAPNDTNLPESLGTCAPLSTRNYNKKSRVWGPIFGTEKCVFKASSGAVIVIHACCDWNRVRSLGICARWSSRNSFRRLIRLFGAIATKKNPKTYFGTLHAFL